MTDFNGREPAPIRPGHSPLNEPMRLGLIGYPLGHSRSPGLHEAALREAGLQGEYRLYPIPPDPGWLVELEALLDRLRQRELRGLNVTIPHKGTVMPYVDRLSETAKAVGAVNTLFVDEAGRLCGENTDVPGFLRDVQPLTGGQAGEALVLGAGGSARAVVYALARAGWQVQVLARRVEQAESLVQELGGAAARLSAGLLHETDLMERATGCTLVVNTTPLGMYPHPEGCPWPEDLQLPEGAAIYDLVYNPIETVFVRRARAQGLPAATGAGMLIAQAALSFAIWTGLEAPFTVMEQHF